jgi:isopentenyl-diphosphate delta-isomerase
MRQVVLVDEFDREIGVMEKMEAHQRALLHRAFSVFIFDSEGRMLLQRRALLKYHSGGLWTNACCSHPRPGESVLAAAERRLFEELGFSTPLKKVFDFIYKAPLDNGLTEFEFDHVLTGIYDGVPVLDKEEVSEVRLMTLDDIRESLVAHPELYTAWFAIAFSKLTSSFRWVPRS